MTILTWNDQYCIGNALIDEEHQALFRLINEFHSQWSQNHDLGTILPILNQLIRYSQQHFQDEERIMEMEGYPLLEAHRKCHEKLIEDIFRLHEEFSSHNVRLEHDVQKFLKHWLVDHVIHNDYAFRDYLVGRSNRPT